MTVKTSKQTDHGFDGISDKFAKNIYGTTKGQLRHALLCHHLTSLGFVDKAPMQVLDSGCGLGHMAEFFAHAGHDVHGIDISSESITYARQAAVNQHLNIDYTIGSLQSVTRQYDLIINHAVLEWLHEPYEAINLLLKQVNTGGHLSLSFFNKEALTFGNLVYGNFNYVKSGLKVKKKVRLNPQQPLSVKAVITYLNNLSHIEVVHQAGIRCIHDYMRDLEHQTIHYEALLDAEIKYSTQSPYMWLGKYFHIVLRKI